MISTMSLPNRII
uniref:Uncharacterized protein n=1 Tax=Rhizophora mucronata TaxID=61149 RepID=A0A2P2Q2H0_RHIMU